MSKQKVKLTNLILEVGGKKIELSISEARELYNQLDELFGSQTIFAPSAPVIIERNRWPYPRDVWYSSMTVGPTGGVDDLLRTTQSKLSNNASISWVGEDASNGE